MFKQSLLLLLFSGLAWGATPAAGETTMARLRQFFTAAPPQEASSSVALKRYRFSIGQLFRGDELELSAAGRARLSDFFRRLTSATPPQRIRITSHGQPPTDALVGAGANLAIIYADRVKNFLVNQGLSPEIITVRGTAVPVKSTEEPGGWLTIDVIWSD